MTINMWRPFYASGIVLEKLTKEDVLKAEEHFGVKLPREYVDLLHIQNGGYLLKDSINIDVEIENEHTLPIDYLLGIKENKGIMETKYLFSEWEIDHNQLIVISGDGHYFIVLDYSKDQNNPNVAYLNSDSGELIELFPTFYEFMNELKPEDDENSYDHEEEINQFLRNPNLVAAKKLVNSDNEDLIYQGIEYWGQTGKDKSEFNRLLLHIVQHTKFLSVQALVAGILWRKVASEEIKEKSAIQAVFDSIPDSPLDLVKEYKQKIVEELNG